MHRADSLSILIISLSKCLDVRTKIGQIYDLINHTLFCTVFRTRFVCVHLDHSVHLVDDRLKRLASFFSFNKLSGVHSVCSGLTRHYVVLASTCTDREYVGVVALRTTQNVVSSSTCLTKSNLQRRKLSILDRVDQGLT